jgi:hypothetical protein
MERLVPPTAAISLNPCKYFTRSARWIRRAAIVLSLYLGASQISGKTQKRGNGPCLHSSLSFPRSKSQLVDTGRDEPSLQRNHLFPMIQSFQAKQKVGALERSLFNAPFSGQGRKS